MKKIFVAYAFQDVDRALANKIDRLLASHDIKAINGERLGGGEVTPEVKTLIEQSDGVIALLTKRDQIKGKKNIWTTHDWVKYELDHARDNGQKAIALIEKGVQVPTVYGANEYIVFEPDNLLEAFLRLSETVAIWKNRIGRTLKVRILPPTLARKVGQAAERIKCRHRYYIGGTCTEWKEITPVEEPGGTFVYLQGVHDDHAIQLEVEEEEKATWMSVAAPQWVPIQLKLNRKVVGK